MICLTDLLLHINSSDKWLIYISGLFRGRQCMRLLMSWPAWIMIWFGWHANWCSGLRSAHGPTAEPFFISISSFFIIKKRDETRKLLVRAKCIIRRVVNTLFPDKTVKLTGLNRNWRSKFMSSETFDNFRGTLLKSFINRNVFKVRFN